LQQSMVRILFVVFVLVVIGVLVFLDRFLYRQLCERFRQFQHSWIGRLFRWCIYGMPVLFLAALIIRRWVSSSSPVMFGVTLLLAFWYLPKLPVALGWWLVSIVRRWWKPSALSFSAQRRSVLQGTLAIAAGYPYIVAAVGAARTTYNVQVQRRTLHFADLPAAFAPLRIVQISDLHVGSFPDPLDFFQPVFERIAALQPDLVVVTGDWVNFDPRELEPLLPLFRQLRVPLGIYGCLGNHDHYMSSEDHQQLKEIIRGAGVHLLVNEADVLERSGERLAIVGTDNTGTGQYFGDLPKAMKEVPENTFALLLAHTPSYWDKAVRGKAPIALMLAGHTHGGQLALPLGVVTLNPAHLVFRYVQGLYADPGGQMLYVNAGLGTTFFPLRTGVPPEITLLELRSPV